MQNYLPLANFLRHQGAQCTDQAALESINSQLAYTQHLYDNRLTEEELQRRAVRMQYLKARFKATFTDNRPQYRARLAVSKLAQLGVAA